MVNQELFISTVFIAGLLSFFAPCILPVLPVYVGVLSGNKTNHAVIRIGKLEINLQTLLKSFVFVSGISTCFIILGFGAGALGSLISSRAFIIACGVVVVLLGIHQVGLIQIPILERQKKLDLKISRQNSLLGNYLLGFTFSFGWTPCIGPVLGTVLGLSASGGQAVYGALLMLIYSLGLMIPFMMISVFSDLLLTRVKKLNKYMKKIKVAGGVIIIIMGILLMTDNLNAITILYEKLRGTI